MNLKNNKEISAGTTDDSSTNADNMHVSPAICNTNVGGSSFSDINFAKSFYDVVQEFDKYATKELVDGSWGVHKNGHTIMVQLEEPEKKAMVSIYGYGSCPALIAKTPDELRECLKCWLRNR